MNAPEKFKLSDGERNHPLWLRLEAHMKERLEQLRVQNDKPQSELDTAALRGQIAEMKRFINLGKPPQIFD